MSGAMPSSFTRLSFLQRLCAERHRQRFVRASPARSWVCALQASLWKLLGRAGAAKPARHAACDRIMWWPIVIVPTGRGAVVRMTLAPESLSRARNAQFCVGLQPLPAGRMSDRAARPRRPGRAGVHLRPMRAAASTRLVRFGSAHVRTFAGKMRTAGAVLRALPGAAEHRVRRAQASARGRRAGPRGDRCV